ASAERRHEHAQSAAYRGPQADERGWFGRLNAPDQIETDRGRERERRAERRADGEPEEARRGGRPSLAPPPDGAHEPRDAEQESDGRERRARRRVPGEREDQVE